MPKSGVIATSDIARCFWGDSDKFSDYHDYDWGILYDDPIRLFEIFLLGTFAAGLPWSMVVSRVEGFRAAFANCDPRLVGSFSDGDVECLLQDTAILRNKNKILATINNARCYVELATQTGRSVHDWLIQFMGGQPIILDIPNPKEFPEKSDLSSQLANDFKKRGFKLLGSVVCQNILYAGGYINGLWNGCSFKHPLK
jgi:DNA-3-methyladenine glycosylase I